jgi:hypothetical protein
MSIYHESILRVALRKLGIADPDLDGWSLSSEYGGVYRYDCAGLGALHLYHDDRSIAMVGLYLNGLEVLS